ncbi:MAG: SagB/ThcOx family dehydrogenase [Promethearchaeota archaeon]
MKIHDSAIKLTNSEFIVKSAGLETIKLNEPNKERGFPFMETLSVKASTREWSDRDLSLQDISDLLWAANGINRPDEKKYTASSAQNAHDVDLYLFMRDGVYRYDADAHALEPVLAGDFRSQLMMTPPPRPKDAGGPPPPPPPPPSNPPIQIILVSDVSRFKFGPPELKPEWGAIDAGIVSQNISLFCAATGLGTRPRASMDKDVIKNLLKLNDTQYVFLNHPIGYSK